MEEGAHGAARMAMPRDFSVLVVLGAAALCGVGIFLISYFLTFFYWPAFGGVGFVIVGALLLFNHRTGPDHA